MAVTYYDMEKLGRMSYDQKLAFSEKRRQFERSKASRWRGDVRASGVSNSGEQCGGKRKQCAVT